MGFNILGEQFVRIASAPSRLLDERVDVDRGQAELDRIKLSQHIDLTPDQRLALNIMLNSVDEKIDADGLGIPVVSDVNSEQHDLALGTDQCQANYCNIREQHIMREIDGVVDGFLQYREDTKPSDRSQPPGMTLDRGYGDCEDYSILKYKLARASGIPADRLAIADLDSSPDQRDGAHAVLMYRDTNNQWFVLNDDGANDVAGTDQGNLVSAEDYFSQRSAPYRVYNEDEAGFNPSFGEATFAEYVHNDTPLGTPPR